MTNVHVHIRMRKCCRQTLKKLDDIRAAAKRADRAAPQAKASPGAGSTLLATLGSLPIPKATLAANQLHASRSDLVRVGSSGRSAWDHAVSAHRTVHSQAGETLEAAFWSAVGEPLEALDLTVSPDVYAKLTERINGKNKVSLGSADDAAGRHILERLHEAAGNKLDVKGKRVLLKVKTLNDGTTLHLGVGQWKTLGNETVTGITFDVLGW
jgi:hypothetical protein